MDTAAVLAERKTTHGLYDDDAECAMQLIDVLEDVVGTLPLTAVQRHALHMICHKIARIVTGKADFKDHWDDIAGYATLVADRCGSAAALDELVAESERLGLYNDIMKTVPEPTARNSHPQCRDDEPTGAADDCVHPSHRHARPGGGPRNARPGRREDEKPLNGAGLNKPPCYCAPDQCMCDTGVPKYVYCKRAEAADRAVAAAPYAKDSTERW